MYSARLLDHFQNPRNVGELADPDIAIRVENPICGDILALTARVGDGKIVEVAYQTRGCTASIAAGSALTELMVGAARSDLDAINATVIEAALDGLPNESKHAARLAEDGLLAVKAALSQGE